MQKIIAHTKPIQKQPKPNRSHNPQSHQNNNAKNLPQKQKLIDTKQQE